MNTTEQQVSAAADRLVAAFARHDREAYFAAFAPQASFVFHHVDEYLPTRAAYGALWRRWEQEDGFRVLGCSSHERRVQCQGDVAWLVHKVHTHVATHAGRSMLQERETIVFAREGGRWLAVHEHLSPGTSPLPDGPQKPVGERA